MSQGREGDWECNGCKNRNYAFRSFCNRCKQPRLLVDTKTPADSKWLPRIGDWICTGCTNNNYASREKCKKCGQPKEVAAMPATAMPGASLPTYSHYFARTQGGPQPNVIQQIHLASTYPLDGIGSAFPYANPSTQVLSVPKGWRNGDWICNCGFHNYTSRTQCKKCNALPSALGTKRLASEEFVHDWDNKRLNIGPTNGQPQCHPGFEQMVGTSGNPITGLYASYPSVTSGVHPSLQVPVQLPQATAPILLGKGAKQWRNGDWMCSNCNNHNYASRAQCNRCKTQRDPLAQPVNAL